MFWFLAESRGWGPQGTPLPISGSEILAYFGLFRIDDMEERDEVIHFIRDMDHVWLKAKTKK